MPTELRLNRCRYLPRFQAKNSRFEWLNHHAKPKPAQLSAIRARWTRRFFLGQFREIRAAFKRHDQSFRLFLGFNQNVGSRCRLDSERLRAVCSVSWI